MISTGCCQMRCISFCFRFQMMLLPKVGKFVTNLSLHCFRSHFYNKIDKLSESQNIFFEIGNLVILLSIFVILYILRYSIISGIYKMLYNFSCMMFSGSRSIYVEMLIIIHKFQERILDQYYSVTYLKIR